MPRIQQTFEELKELQDAMDKPITRLPPDRSDPYESKNKPISFEGLNPEESK